MRSSAVVWVTSVLFGLSHAHHSIGLATKQGEREGQQRGKGSLAYNYLRALILGSGAQVCFTTLFGLFASFLFLHSGNLASSLSAHMVCNAIGPPDFAKLLGFRQSEENFRYTALTCLGLCSFCILLYALPTLQE